MAAFIAKTTGQPFVECAQLSFAELSRQAQHFIAVEEMFNPVPVSGGGSVTGQMVKRMIKRGVGGGRR